MVNTEWFFPPRDLRLRASEVHVWRAHLDSEIPFLERFEGVLSVPEQERAARFVLQRDRIRFVVGRGVLRFVLARYTGWPATMVPLTLGPAGKPRLPVDEAGAATCFNVSHSDGLVVCAVARDREIGIDIEALRPSTSYREIAEHSFSPVELAEWRALPPEHLLEGFFMCWTRKEAYVKAVGAGLSLSLRSFAVSLTPGRPAVLTSEDAEKWAMRSFCPDQGYVGAIVAEGSDWSPTFWNWSSRRGLSLGP